MDYPRYMSIDVYKRQTEARKVANNMENLYEKAKAYTEDVKQYFDQIRYHIDKLELVIDNEDWPLVKYREMLFIR